jgi:hypothetical protein
MGNYLKMTDKRRVLALLELGWTYRRIERETGVRRETIARYDPRRESKAANLSTGSEVSADAGEAHAANLSADANAPHGPPGLAAPYCEQIEAGLRQGLTAQRIWQDLCADPAVLYPHSYASVRRYVRRLKQQHPKLVDVMQHPPGEETQVDFFQGPPTFDEAQGRWRRPWIFRMTLSCSKHGYKEPLWTQERDGFLRAHEHAFVRLGGVPKVIRHDNLKAAVVRAFLATGDKGGGVAVWDLTASDPTASVISLRNPGGKVSSFAFSPDNHWLATGGYDGVVSLWSLRLDDLITLACHTAGRNLNENEWQHAFLGIPLRATCP